MITIQLLQVSTQDSQYNLYWPQPKEADIDIKKISVMMVKVGGYNDLPSKLYSILVDGQWFTLKDEEEYNRIKRLFNAR